MSRNLISISLSILFLAFLVTPTVTVFVDELADVSMFYSVSEEEEKGDEKDIEVENLFFELQTDNEDLVSSNIEGSLGYFFKKYQNPDVNLLSPPPKLHVL